MDKNTNSTATAVQAQEERRITPAQKFRESRDLVLSQIKTLCNEGKLNLPTNYSAGNALMQAQLMIQDDYKAMSCTKASICSAFLTMCVTGLNPKKGQCYFIPYGQTLSLDISYKGYAAIAKRIDPTISDIVSRVVTKDEEFDFEDLPNGYSRILKHKRSIESMEIKDPNKDIVAAYATIIYKNGEMRSLIMPYSEILKRWRMSQRHPVNQDGTLKPDSTHAQFPDKMACRTVTKAICMPIVSESDDNDLFISTVMSNTVENARLESDAEAEEKMCEGDVVDIEPDYEDKVDVDTGEINN